MEHRQLLNFLSICEKKSFSKASEERFISQQGLSKSIKQLEEQLGVPLFYRTARGIDLTEFGYALKEAAHSYLNHHDQIIDAVRKLKEKNIYRLAVGMTIGFHANFPPCFFKNFILNYPDISLDIMTFPNDTCQDSLLTHKIPLGFSCTPINADIFDSVCCKRSKLALLTGKEHRFARRPCIRIKELRKEKVAIVNTRTYPFSTIADIFRKYGIKPSIYLDGSENSLLYELCSTNRIVSFWPGPIRQSPELVSIPIEDIDIYFEFHLIVNKTTYVSEAANQFIAYTKENFGN
ncbi:MAG: LysR family transcriptional regulator [Treponema sp.]|jgi:DNA-binding transcriptional LysR family regulator|nr:LysR family transcriptional regulator [Treponema sp.]